MADQNKTYYIYGLIEGGWLVYVGMTKNFEKRLYNHRKSGKFPSTISGVLLDTVSGSKEARQREKEIIECLLPEENFIHNPTIEGSIISWKNPKTGKVHRVTIKPGMLHPDKAFVHWYSAIEMSNADILLLIGWSQSTATKVLGDRTAWRWTEENKKKWHPKFKDV